jgi:hypothetical protein
VTTINVEESAIFGLLKEQEAALEAGDVAEARRLLEEIRVELGKQYDWPKLKDPGPESYEQLLERLKNARDLVSLSSKTEMGQLRDVFEWCRDHGIKLTDLQVKSTCPSIVRRRATCTGSVTVLRGMTGRDSKRCAQHWRASGKIRTARLYAPG